MYLYTKIREKYLNKKILSFFMVVIKIDPREKERYVGYHLEQSTLDLEIAKKNIEISGKWSIIIGYYSMHNIVKYYLGKYHNRMIKQPRAHEDSFKELQKVLRQTPQFKIIKILIEEAKKEFHLLIFQDVDDLINAYSQGIEKRKNQNYYQKYASKKENARKFHTDIVVPFVEIIKKLEE